MNIVRGTEANLRMSMTDTEGVQTFKQARMLLNGPAKGWWEHVKEFHSDDFVKEIDGELK